MKFEILIMAIGIIIALCITMAIINLYKILVLSVKIDVLKMLIELEEETLSKLKK